MRRRPAAPIFWRQCFDHTILFFHESGHHEMHRRYMSSRDAFVFASCLCVRMRVCVCVCLSVCLFVCQCALCVYVCGVCVCARVRVCSCVCVVVCVCVWLCVVCVWRVRCAPHFLVALHVMRFGVVVGMFLCSACCRPWRTFPAMWHDRL